MNDIKQIYFHWTAVFPFVVLPMLLGLLHLGPPFSFLIGMVGGFGWVMWRMVKA